MDHRVDRLRDLAREYRGQARDFGRMKGYEWAERDARRNADVLMRRARMIDVREAQEVRA